MKLLAISLLIMAAVALGQTPAATPPKDIPAITQATVEARLSELDRGRAQALANLNAYDGAIQECQYWLATIKQKAAPKPTEKSKPDAGSKGSSAHKEKSDVAQ